MKAQFPAEYRILEHIVVVDHGVHDRKLALDVDGREAVKVHRTRVKVAAIATAREVELGQGVVGRDEREQIARLHVLEHAVVVEIVLVRQHRPIPSPHPLIRKIELARRFYAAAPVAIARRVYKQVLVELEQSCGADAVGPIESPLAPLALQQRTLRRRDHRSERRIVIGCERPVVRNRDPEPVHRARAVTRRQHTGLALHGRIRRRHIRKVGHRDAEELEPSVLEIEHLLALIVDDPRGLHLPFGRFPRIVLARLAGGIDAVMKDGEIARFLRALGGEAGLLRRIQSQRINKTVAIVVAQIHDLAMGDRAVALRQRDVAFGMQALGLLIIDHPVGFERRVAEVELYVADRRHALVAVVVIDLRRAHEHLLLRALGFDRRLRTRRKHQHLGERRRQARRAGDQHGGGRKHNQRAVPGAPTRRSRMGG